MKRLVKFEDRPADWKAGYHRGYIVGVSGQRSRGVRWREDVFEMRCADCAHSAGSMVYWPLTPEFWNPRNLSACRACLLTRKRIAAKRAYWADPETARARTAEYQRRHSTVVLMKKRARYAEDPTTAREAHAAWREANRDALRAYRRAYYARNRAHILQREKLRRAGVLPPASRRAA